MTIAEFLLALATDSDLLRQFVEEPEAGVREAGLGKAQRALLLSGNLRELRVKIKAEFEVDGERVAFHTVYGVPTVYAPPPPPPPSEK